MALGLTKAIFIYFCKAPLLTDYADHLHVEILFVAPAFLC